MPDPGALADARLRQFRDHGWTTLPRLFTAREIAAMRAEIDRLQAAGRFRNLIDAESADRGAGGVNLQICPLAPHSRLFRALPFQPRVIAAVGALIGEPLVCILDQVFVKPPGDGAGTDWHQDNAYFGDSDPTRGTGLWIAIHDATLENGTMHVVSGSHREPQRHRRDERSTMLIHAEVDEARAVPVELQAGDALCFNFGVLHCTKRNRSRHARAGLALHFAQEGHLPPFDPAQRVVLSGPRASGGRLEHGEDLLAAWAQEVERALASTASQPDGAAR